MPMRTHEQLRPLPIEPKMPESSPPPIPPRPMILPGTEYDADDILDEIAWWKLLQRVKDNLPPGVEKRNLAQLLPWIAKVQTLISGTSLDSEVQTLYQTFSVETRKELLNFWQGFAQLFSSQLSVKALFRFYDIIYVKDDRRLTSLSAGAWQDLIRLLTPLSRNLDINIMATPLMNQTDELFKAAQDPLLESLKVAEVPKLRYLSRLDRPRIKTLELEQDSEKVLRLSDRLPALSVRHINPFGRSLVEYKYYDLDIFLQSRSAAVIKFATSRIDSLAEALQTSKSVRFRTLRCIGWFHEPKLHRHTLAFEFPTGVSISPVSLYEVIQHTIAVGLPTLGERFSIALEIGSALQRWHLAGWVHRGISSRNIYFFRPSDLMRLSYENPYLCGFQHARPYRVVSQTPYVQDFSINVYNHPNVQEEPSEQHGIEHDLYSYGVLLCELGLWMVAEDIFKDLDKHTLTSSKMQQTILAYIEHRLPPQMGTKYYQSAVTCLKGDFGVSGDDAVHSGLLKAFDKLVLRNLEKGLELD